jgi:hypothetical protein
MKKLIIVFTMLVAATSMAQSNSGLGITAGANYGSTGDLKENGQTIIDNPKEKLGFHVGVYYKQDFGILYLRPELKYTQLSNEYNNVQFDLQKIDLPILLGTRIVGPLHIFAGPSLQYIVETDIQDIDTTDLENDFTIGAQFGVGVNLGNLGIDVRYERGLTDNELRFVDNTLITNRSFTIDTRPEQIILALSVKF